MTACLLIPIFNHGRTVSGVVSALADLNLPCLVVDDGSDSATRDALDRLVTTYPWVILEHLPHNRGRGAALRHGYFSAWHRGFSHAVQLDADAQHDAGDVPRLLATARAHPAALVLGQPVFDDTAPRSRLWGRLVSRFWVRVETLSSRIADPLCGFRCIPLDATVTLLRQTPLGDHMDFDLELVVRLLWAGVPVINVPTKVRYFPDGLSHFHMVRDNLRITRAHARLCAGMLPRVPQLLARGRPAP